MYLKLGEQSIDRSNQINPRFMLYGIIIYFQIQNSITVIATNENYKEFKYIHTLTKVLVGIFINTIKVVQNNKPFIKIRKMISSQLDSKLAKLESLKMLSKLC
ncbi:transmembrane protein, putative (macronuclear) [Tetrahymena thermophila SB210]|uniref:Transmembrane protein, putative n=1 Tax=Tetrahymena thermophila (strain SB210) TaxID=312017 RepID=Q23H62_TETTS|nr:transmembrane protein, putative [Tetrahymena thermophila SB210]EAR95864.1 transmembrane protein, putative [Tetrahymena thermophila SB210]|eukprot:XP_001016109.1 transmembrane protein, putative [Tetrahymena thermophila SB210]